MALTDKQLEFVNQFFLCNMNQTQAYKNAYGVTDDNVAAVNGHKLRNAKEISDLIEQRLLARTMTADEVLDRLAEQARGEHGRYIRVDGSVDIKQLVQDGKGYLIKGIKKTRYGTVYEFHDMQAAQVHLGRYHALFTDRIKIESWQDELIENLKNGRLSPADVLREFPDLAHEFFKKAGIEVD